MNWETLDIYKKALQAFTPQKLVTDALSESIQIGNGSYYLFAVGKAAIPMAKAATEWFREDLEKVLVISPNKQPDEPGITFMRGTHPLPDESSQKAAQALIHFVENIPSGANVIGLLSGGASSLIASPAGKITIEELRTVFDLLNTCGAAIKEINTVRKHLSKIKGGQLLRHFPENVKLINLAISDVPGNDLEIIGSGPTVADSSTFDGAYQILMKYELWDRLPETVRSHIQDGLEGKVPETVKPDENGVPQPDLSRIIGSAKMFAEEVAKNFETVGYQTWIAPKAYSGSAETVAENIAAEAKRIAKDANEVSFPAALIYYGESTVKVTGSGKGGRNQELALHAALAVDGYPNISWLSVGTDGIDGPTDAAGALISGETLEKARKKGLDGISFLRNNDSYHFHQKMDTLVKTGPTGNNVMDIQIVVIEKEEI